MKSFKTLSLTLLMLLLVFSCTKTDSILSEENLQNENVTQNFKSNDAPSADGRYIVVFKKSVTDSEVKANNLKEKKGLAIGHVYKYSIKGCSAYLTESEYQSLKADSDIDYIEPDFPQKASSQIIPTGVSRIMAHTYYSVNSDVDVAVIDSGVDINHPDLNVVGGVRFYSINNGSGSKSFTDSKYDDDYGHGTHVAGTIGALNNDFGVVGVAPGCRIWAVKVLDNKGDGFTSDIIKALDWIAERASTIEVVNMSLGGTGTSVAYREAIKNCVSKGIIIFAAAGNSYRDIYGYDNIMGTYDDEMPAAFPEVATISALVDTDGTYGGFGASTLYGPDDSFGKFSNYSRSVVANNPVNSPGKAIDLMLPGYDIYSTAKGGKYETMSGTSQATPHAAGLAVLYIAKYGRAHDSLGVYAIRQALIDNGIPQSHQYALSVQSDPDGFYENLGWVNTTSTPPTSLNLSITAFNPLLLKIGNNDVVISGTGFKTGTTIYLENGTGGSTPVINNLTVQNSETITASVFVEDKSPYKLRYWNLRVSNIDGTTALYKKYVTIDATK